MTDPSVHRINAAAKRERMRQVLRRDPSLEPWQLAERFGYSRHEAATERSAILQELGIADRLAKRAAGGRR